MGLQPPDIVLSAQDPGCPFRREKLSKSWLRRTLSLSLTDIHRMTSVWICFGDTISASQPSLLLLCICLLRLHSFRIFASHSSSLLYLGMALFCFASHLSHDIRYVLFLTGIPHFIIQSSLHACIIRIYEPMLVLHSISASTITYRVLQNAPVLQNDF
jgi:hypothetical protein